MIEFMKESANGCSSILMVFKSFKANSETRLILIVNLRPK